MDTFFMHFTQELFYKYLFFSSLENLFFHGTALGLYLAQWNEQHTYKNIMP
jgi:hypothetical protein